MLRTLCSIVAVAITLTTAPGVATAAHKARHSARHPATQRHTVRHWHGYGFLPGYVPPEVVAHERDLRDHLAGRFYAIPAPRFYQGRWNGGGFGPCYTYTPIGPMWNCGR